MRCCAANSTRRLHPVGLEREIAEARSASTRSVRLHLAGLRFLAVGRCPGDDGLVERPHLTEQPRSEDRSAEQKGGELTGPNPTDRGKAGSKYHLLCDANGLPLHVLLSAANTHDSILFEPLLETNPAVRRRRGRPGRPQRRPAKLHADKGYDYRRC